VAGLRSRPESTEGAETVESADNTEQQVEGVLNGVLGEAPTERDEQPSRTESVAIRRAADVAADRRAEPADADAEVETREVPAEPVRKPRPRTVDGSRPAGKRRTTGAARPDDLVVAEKGAGTKPGRLARHARVDDRPTRTPAQRQISVAIVLAVVAVILGGLAVYFRGEIEKLTSGDSNSALTDSGATSQVTGQLSDAIKKTFSYNYTDLDSTEKAVKEVLSGKALCEYNLLFAELKQYAPEQKIILATTVRQIGVVRLEGDRAEALIYIDQQSTRVDTNKTVYVGAQFAVQAHRDNDRWKIIEFDMFGQNLFSGKATPTC
jgi:Mce-associated membrane protein